MRIFVPALLILIVSCTVSGLVIADTVDPYGPAREAAREAVKSKPDGSIAVAVFRDGKIDWEEGFGWIDPEKKIKATPHVSYSMASISKPFTATGLMTLVERGVVDLDKPVNDYLGAAKVQARIGNADDATVRRVANHTSGLPFHGQFFYYDTSYRRPSMDETIRKYGQLISIPGERYNYSNLGFGILDSIIARKSGKSFARYMKDAVFDPLGLKETSIGPSTSKSVIVAPRYTKDGTPLPYYDTDHAGASEVYSSAHDLVRFAAFHLKAHLPDQRAILTDADIDQMHVNTARPGSDRGYGIGFATAKRGDYIVVSHNGGMPGVTTEMSFVPAKGVAIVVLGGEWPRETIAGIADKIAVAILPGWPASAQFAPQQRIFTPPPELVGTWTGKLVRQEGDMPASFVIGADGSVTGAFGNHPPVPMEHPAFRDGRLSGAFAASLDTKESERYSYKVVLDAKLDGTRLYGGAAASDDVNSDKFVAGLTHWIDLQRKP